MSTSPPPPLTLKETREFYSWRRAGKSGVFIHLGEEIIMDPTKTERFLKHEQHTAANDQIYTDIIYYNDQNKKEMENFVECEVAKVQVKFTDCENKVNKHSVALADLRRVDVKNELIIEDLNEIISKINANQNILREYGKKSRKIMLEELKERERTNLEMILHSLNVPDFAKKSRQKWDSLPKETPVKELNKEKLVTTELRDYIATEINKIAASILKDKSNNFFDYIRNVKLIAEKHPNRLGMIKVVVTFYTSHYSQLALSLIEDATDVMSPIANNAQKSRTKREMRYINDLYEQANQLNRNMKIKNAEWAKNHKIEVIGGNLLATSTIKKRILPGGIEHDTHMQITENGGKKIDGTPINPDFYISDDEDYENDDDFIHSDIPRHLMDINNLAIHQVDRFLHSQGKPPNSLATEESTDRVRNLKDQFKAGCYADPSKFLRGKFPNSYKPDENSEATSIRIAEKQRRKTTQRDTSAINRRFGSGNIYKNQTHINANISKLTLRENNSRPVNPHINSNKPRKSSNIKRKQSTSVYNNNISNESIFQESRQVSGSRWEMGTNLGTRHSRIDTEKIFEDFKRQKQKQRQNELISNNFQPQDNSEKSDAENDTYLESGLDLDNLHLTGQSSSSSEIYTQEDSHSSTMSQYSQSQNFNDLLEYDQKYNLLPTRILTMPRNKRTKTASTDKRKQKNKYYTQRSKSISPGAPEAGSRKRKNKVKKSPTQPLPFTPVTSRTRSSVIRGDKILLPSNLTYSKSHSPSIIHDSQPSNEYNQLLDINHDTITSTPKIIDETRNDA